MQVLSRSFTPREIVSELDRHIVGQEAAKKAVAIALRNRYRRQKVDPVLAEEIMPKNIILMGPTGCGKTEIARRLAKLADAPFVKVEATKFTEVGYVGRDVDSMVRDLVEASVKMCKEEALLVVDTKARALAEETILDLLLPSHKTARLNIDTSLEEPADAAKDDSRERLRAMLREGSLSDREVLLDAKPGFHMPVMHMFAGAPGAGGLEDMASGIQEALQSALSPGKRKKRKVKVSDALEILKQEEAQKLIDLDQVHRDAITKAEQAGIIFIDEIDKITGRSGMAHGPDVSREGVQRDILPIVEGSSVSTKYGTVKTDHILFIAAGAFHISKPSDLIPELQGRFPIRVEMTPLTEANLIQILKEPESSLIKQYTALLATEGTTLEFTEEGVKAIAKVAAQVNSSQENIGARRLYTIMEKLLEEESFHAPDKPDQHITIDGSWVQTRLEPILQTEDLSKYIL